MVSIARCTIQPLTTRIDPTKSGGMSWGRLNRSDECVLHEPDGLFNVGFSRSSSGKFMILETESTETNEVYLIDLESDSKNPPEARLVQKRVRFIDITLSTGEINFSSYPTGTGKSILSC